jgi:hypothetical protein
VKGISSLVIRIGLLIKGIISLVIRGNKLVGVMNCTGLCITQIMCISDFSVILQIHVP